MFVKPKHQGEMHMTICQKCGAECPPETNFCRQCGAPIASEQTTALLNQTDGVTTHRLESRETGRNRSSSSQPAGAPAAEKSSRKAILLGAMVIVALGVISVAALVGMRKHNAASGDDLVYPGAKTVVDMTNASGGRALHLQTSDPFETVEAWYQKALKPEKTIRLTSTSVILKNGKTTATLAEENNVTNILIKVTD